MNVGSVHALQISTCLQRDIIVLTGGPGGPTGPGSPREPCSPCTGNGHTKNERIIITITMIIMIIQRAPTKSNDFQYILLYQTGQEEEPFTMQMQCVFSGQYHMTISCEHMLITVLEMKK